MIGARKRRRARTSEERQRDRRARRFGVMYLSLAIVVAVVHDHPLGLPPSPFLHEIEQIALAAMWVIGMLGALLVVEGHELFEDPHRIAVIHRRPPCIEDAARRVRFKIDPNELDSRHGIALLLARRALDDAGDRASQTSTRSSNRIDQPRT